jgi:hypothetical protein
VSERTSLAERAARAVNAIVEDLSDRRGLRQEWENIDEDVQIDIKLQWSKIIAKHFEESKS